MRKQIIIIGIGLILFHSLTELHSLITVLNKQVSGLSVDLFLSPAYKMLLQFCWYLKMNFDSLLVIATYYFFAWVASKYSRRLFYIASVWFLYHVLDLYMFWWNYKSTYWVYWCLLIAGTIQTVLLLIPIKERAKIVSME
jgi:hypothetical protein